MTQLIQKHSAIVTGGASGLGALIARRLAEDEAHVIVADVDERAAETLAQAIRGSGGRAQACAADVTREADVAALVEQAAAAAPLGVAVLSAAVEHRAPLTETTDEAWQQVLDVNLKGPWLCMKHCIPQMAAAGGGSIVALGSTLGLIASPDYVAYASSKGALANLCKLASTDCAADGVRVNLVAPSATDTGLFIRTTERTPDPGAIQRQVASASPMKRLGRGEEVAETVLFLCSDAAAYISGAVVPIDGGLAARRAWTS